MQSIINQLHLDRPVLVGWSLGGFVIEDYLQFFGQSHIRAINYVSSAPNAVDSHLLPLTPVAANTVLPQFYIDDTYNYLNSAKTFAGLLSYLPFSPEKFDQILGYEMLVPPTVRGFVFNEILGATYDRVAVFSPSPCRYL